MTQTQTDREGELEAEREVADHLSQRCQVLRAEKDALQRNYDAVCALLDDAREQWAEAKAGRDEWRQQSERHAAEVQTLTKERDEAREELASMRAEGGWLADRTIDALMAKADRTGAAEKALADTREALERLEAANDRLASLRTQDEYNAMVSKPAVCEALVALDFARRDAREILAAARAATGDQTPIQSQEGTDHAD
ncbi:MAG TPA: hypothetical protein VHL98_10850 [Microvirga sp.]|jgi:chromosome segregation ATPase|nr:hypothetical protein [Microvirga sp.]